MGYSVFALRAIQNVQTPAAGFDPAQESKKARGFQIVSVILFSLAPPIESERNDEMLEENERIAWAAVSERTCLCRMRMTLL